MNKIGRFGEYGGQYVPEIVMNAVNCLLYTSSKQQTEQLSPMVTNISLSELQCQD